jgi:carotenoid cleavage dioxygenase-like enzyme
MVTINSNTTKKLSWKKAFIKSASEFDSIPLDLISGAIPTNLQGSFYSIGPGLLERNGEKIAHWFDGDGGILKVDLTGEKATATYRYVQTEAYQKEQAEGKFSYGSYGRLPSGSFWQKLTMPIKNRANSGIVALDDRLLALWNAGAPYSVNPQDLSTLGIDPNFGSAKEELPYASSPKTDPDTGYIYNFGIEYGTKAKLKLYCSDRHGKLLQQKDLPLDGFPYIHNFILAGQYLVFFIPPLRLKLMPFLSKRKSFSESLAWQPEEQTQILVVDRTNFTIISKGETNAWFGWNYGNGCVNSEGNIVAEVVAYQDFEINKFLGSIPGESIYPCTKGNLLEIILNPTTGNIEQTKTLLADPCENPAVSTSLLGKPWRFTYLFVYSPSRDSLTDLPDVVACRDRQTGELTTAYQEENCFHIIMTPVGQKENLQAEWLIVQVFNATANRSEIWIFSGDKLDSEPVAKLALPEVIPFGFSGIWQGH